MTSNSLSHTVLKDIGFMLLAEGKTIRVRADGMSMYPSIKSGSVIFIEPYEPGANPRPGEIIAWKRDAGIVVHRLVSVYDQKMQKHFVTRGDSCLADDDPIVIDQIAGKVVRIEYTEGKPVPPHKYAGIKPNYRLNSIFVRIISQIYRILHPKPTKGRDYPPNPPGGGQKNPL